MLSVTIGTITAVILSNKSNYTESPTTSKSVSLTTEFMTISTSPATKPQTETTIMTTTLVTTTTTSTTTTRASTTTTTVYDGPLSNVLVLNTWSSLTHPQNPPVLTNSSGDVERELDFVIDDDTEVERSCSLTWHNKLYVFGGKRQKKQISRVDSCGLHRIGSLAFEHVYGDCVTVADARICVLMIHVKIETNVVWHQHQRARLTRSNRANIYMDPRV